MNTVNVMLETVSMININMRCIEISASIDSCCTPFLININMRCIEIGGTIAGRYATAED